MSGKCRSLLAASRLVVLGFLILAASPGRALAQPCVVVELLGSYGANGKDLFDDVAVDGDIAYVSHGEYPIGLKIYDVSDPNSPLQLGSFDYADGVGTSIAVLGTTVYLTYYYERTFLLVIDVSDPTAPNLIGKASLESDDTRDLVVVGKTSLRHWQDGADNL